MFSIHRRRFYENMERIILFDVDVRQTFDTSNTHVKET